jgi:hypothetical protein
VEEQQQETGQGDNKNERRGKRGRRGRTVAKAGGKKKKKVGKETKTVGGATGNEARAGGATIVVRGQR